MARLTILYMVGSGPQGGGLYRLAQELSLPDRLIWHGALTDEAQIASVANQCRAFVYPGPVGLSLIHAMAYGLPWIVHEDRWRQEPEIAAFSGGITGRAFTCGDAKSLSSTLDAILSNVSSLKYFSETALSKTEESFNVDEMARRFAEIIDLLRKAK